MTAERRYPTSEHELAAQAIVRFFGDGFDVDAVLLVNSCARGKATRDSCLDIVVLAQPATLAAQRPAWEAAWERFNETDVRIHALAQAGVYSVVHLDFTDGVLAPRERDEAAGPDSFELAIGNLLVYGVPLWQATDHYDRLRARWLPYYDEALRLERLAMVRHYCLNNLHHVPLYVRRGLYFQAFDRLYNAYQEFLQALFIARRTYPIAYNKWIREQIVDILGLPDLYPRLVHLLEIRRFESDEIAEKATELEELFDHYAPQAQPL